MKIFKYFNRTLMCAGLSAGLILSASSQLQAQKGPVEATEPAEKAPETEKIMNKVEEKAVGEEVEESSFDEFDDFDDVDLDDEDSELLGEAGLDDVSEANLKEEHLLVGYVSAGVSAVALAAGIGLGIYALTQFSCLQDIEKCNANRSEKITEGKYFDEKAGVEHLAISADAMFLFSAAAALASTFSLVQAYFFDEASTDVATKKDAGLGLKKTDEKVTE